MIVMTVVMHMRVVAVTVVWVWVSVIAMPVEGGTCGTILPLVVVAAQAGCLCTLCFCCSLAIDEQPWPGTLHSALAGLSCSCRGCGTCCRYGRERDGTGGEHASRPPSLVASRSAADCANNKANPVARKRPAATGTYRRVRRVCGRAQQVLERAESG